MTTPTNTVQLARQPATTGGSGEIKIVAPTQTILTSGSGTYTLPAGVQWIRVRMVGGGGGGGGAGSGGTGGAGGSGGSTIFGTSFLTCSGGGGGDGGGNFDGVERGLGGSTTINAGAVGIGLSGGSGTNEALSQAVGVIYAGGAGGCSAFGGNGGGGAGSNVSTGSNTFAAGGGGAAVISLDVEL